MRLGIRFASSCAIILSQRPSTALPSRYRFSPFRRCFQGACYVSEISDKGVTYGTRI